MSTTRTRVPENVIHARDSETEQMIALQHQVDAIFRSDGEAKLIGPDGQEIALPPSAFNALALVVRAMAKGQTLTLIPHGRELTSQQAAEILHVSRPFLIKLLDAGEIPFHRVGSHRRLRVEDVLIYRDDRAKARAEALDRLTEFSQTLPGGYQ